MPKRLFILIACLLTLAAGLGMYLHWRNSPAEVARRFLNQLASKATVYPEDSPLQRRLRGPQVVERLADPLEIRLPASHVNGTFDQEELLSGYLSVVLEAKYFQVSFSQLRLLRKTPGELRIEGRLTVRCDVSCETMPMDQLVDLILQQDREGIRLSRVTARPSRPAPP